VHSFISCWKNTDLIQPLKKEAPDARASICRRAPTPVSPELLSFGAHP